MDEVEWEDASWLDLFDMGHASDAEWADRAQRKSLKRARKSRMESE